MDRDWGGLQYTQEEACDFLKALEGLQSLWVLQEAHLVQRGNRLSYCIYSTYSEAAREKVQ